MKDIVLTQLRLIFYIQKNVESKKTYLQELTCKRVEKMQKQDKTSFTEKKIFKAMF